MVKWRSHNETLVSTDKRFTILPCAIRIQLFDSFTRRYTLHDSIEDAQFYAGRIK